MIDNPYFSHKELACRSTGIVKLADGFLERLIQLREEYNRPMKVNSCCRSASYNRYVGGHPRSLHVYDYPAHETEGTCAIDIKMHTGFDKGELVNVAWRLGWSVGVHKSFIHLDQRGLIGKTQTLFTY
jgi:hypothetical protein